MVFYFLVAVVVIKKIKNCGCNLRVAGAMIEQLGQHPGSWFEISLHQGGKRKDNADAVFWRVVTNQISPNLKGFLGAFDCHPAKQMISKVTRIRCQTIKRLHALESRGSPRLIRIAFRDQLGFSLDELVNDWLD